MTLLLDTSVLIDALRRRLGRHLFLADLVRAGNRLSTAAINLGQIHAGLRPNEVERATALFDDLEQWAITPAIGRRGGELKNAWARRGRTFRDDALIAAVALEHELPLLTDNRKDFPMPELQLWPLPQAQ